MVDKPKLDDLQKRIIFDSLPEPEAFAKMEAEGFLVLSLYGPGKRPVPASDRAAQNLIPFNNGESADIEGPNLVFRKFSKEGFEFLKELREEMERSKSAGAGYQR